MTRYAGAKHGPRKYALDVFEPVATIPSVHFNTTKCYLLMLHSIRRYFQILGALLRQEEDNRRHAPLESLMNLLEPIFLISLLSALFYFMGRRQVAPLGGAPILFYATGFFPLYLFIYTSRRMRGAIDAPTRRFPVEQRLDHILVHVLLRIMDYAVLGILLFGGIYIFFTPQALPHDLVDVVSACLAIVALAFCWGILTLVLTKKSRLLGALLPAFSRVLILFSGVFFVPDFLAPSARYAMSFNPILHAIQLFRLGFYPTYPAITLDTTFLAYCAIFAVFLGFVVERVTRRSEGR